MPHGNIHALGAVDQLQKPHDVVKIIQRLSDAHEHDVRNGHAGIHLGKEHLVQHFVGLQPPHQAAQGGRAEGAAHAAAHLRGNAHGVTVVIAHENGLHAVAVRQLPQIFNGAVPLGLLLPDHPGGQNGVLPLQGLPEAFGQVGHFLIAANALVEPAIDLLCPKGGLAQVPEQAGHFLQGHGFDIHRHLRILEIKNPSVSHCPGSRVSMPVVFSGKIWGSSSFSRENSGCVFKKSSTTSWFSLGSNVQVE